MTPRAILESAPGVPAGVGPEVAASETPELDLLPSLWIHGQRIILRPGVELEDAVILVEKGVIVAIGADLEAPEGARQIEGEVICAGFIDSWSSLGLDQASASDLATNAATRSVDAVDPYYRPHERADALAAGVTAVRVQAGGSASLGGYGAVLRTWMEPDPDVLLEDACVSATVGIDRRGRKLDVFGRAAEVGRLVGLLQKGEAYRKAEVEYRHEFDDWQMAIAEKKKELDDDFKKAKKKRDKDVAKAEEKGKTHKDKKYKEDKQPKKPRQNAETAVLARVAEGEVPIVVEVHGAAELRNLLEKTVSLERLRLIVAGASGAISQADELSERGIPVLFWPNPEIAGADGESNMHLGLAGEFHRAGVEVLLGSGGGRHARDLRLLAALAVSNGLPAEAALHAITLGPARAFDIGDRVGSLERGRDADILIFDGEPLDTRSELQVVISHGRIVVEQ